MDEKYCPRCRTIKPREAFHARGWRGLAGYCKSCMSDYYRSRYVARKPAPKPPRVISLYCKGCQRELEHSDFYWEKKRGYRSSVCKACKTARHKALLEAHPDYDRNASAKHYRKQKAQQIAKRLQR